MIKIIKDPTKYYTYALDCPFNYATLNFCRSLKNQHGFQNFGFEKKDGIGRWRFNNPKFIFDFCNAYPDLELEGIVQADWEKYSLNELKKHEQEEAAEKIKTKITSDLHIEGLKGELYNYQKIGVEFLINNNGKAILADQMGCLSGDTKVIVNRAKAARKYTLQKYYQITQDNNLSASIKSYSRSYNAKTGEFQLNEIKKVLRQGEKKVIQIIAKNKYNKKYVIKVTPDHLILNNERRWIKTNKLKVGHVIMVNGRKIAYCKRCKRQTEYVTYKYAKFKGSCKVCVYKNLRNCNRKSGEFIDKDGYIQISRKLTRHPNNKRRSMYKHVLIMEAYLNRVSYKKWLEIINNNAFNKKTIFINSAKHAVHHKNYIKTDNNIRNLELLTHQQHAQKEAKAFKYKHLNHTFLPEEATVISVKKAGKEMTYDLVMADPHRNFIANGIVVHNCGKTVQALGYVVHTQKKKTLVVCPASVKYVWDGEVAKWTHLTSHVISSKHNLIPFEDFSVFIINFDILKKFSKQLQNFKWDCLIADEFHYLKNPKSLRTREVLKLAPKISSIILLSGTPLLNRPCELYTGLKLMDPLTWDNWYQYTKEFCAGHEGRWGYEYRGASNIPTLRKKISRYFIRRTKDQVLKDLPPKRFIDYPIVLDEHYQEQYDLALKNFRIYLAEVKKKKEPEIAKSMAAQTLVKLGELRQIISNGKIETAKTIIAEVLDNDEKLVVYSVYNKPLKILAKHFPKSVMITGKADDNDRISAINKFQNDPNTKIFFGGIKSAGVGITLTAAATVLFIDFSWVPADHAQAIDRLHRIGQKASSISIYQLYAKNTIDQYMQELLAEKQAIFNELIERPDTKNEIHMVERLVESIESDRNSIT